MKSALLALALLSTAASAATPGDVAAAKAMLGKAVAFPTVEGRGQVPAYAIYLADQLKTAGFTDADLKLEKFGETATLIATYRGRSAGPAILLNGHMDVVEAKREDWKRDPFVMSEDGGYLFGRGVGDNKFDVTMMVQTLMALKRSGFRPKTDLVLILTGDEETQQATTAALAPRFHGAAMLLNGDGGGGALSSDRKPLYYSLQTAEKTYADYKLTVTDPGGHSSRPGPTNAIGTLSAAIGRLVAYSFPVESSDTTRAFFKAGAKRTTGALSEAMTRFAADPSDAGAIATLAANPEYAGTIRTTCVPTMIEGGHAPNALPQRVVATVNCRIFPGTAPQAVMAKLQELAGPAVAVTQPEIFPQSSTSPLRPDLMAALTKAVRQRDPAMPIIPMMEAGTTDSLFFRAEGIPSYGVAGLAMRPEDMFAHGLDERVPTDAIGPALDHWRTLLTELAK